ncbi:uncharacterized protein CYBJADRAFT_56572 [Cyberlindnera jadinii NRRL Y-1542]|uniref:Uncharacterized protein n=1 Tax=Cyberlindnera jadinii (strain ATCC 18201 / CBS 1600 / BCRC 20928 / JCM 3617 / NBRC 0987 / NRRL Y-1542) TaxID=983966 RepID=A0A1E4RU19_CYBJN|nr:hypothetical protein CYBJADRAFT_56572 [Cyberlindnera jadinii NRRL Y-1542]ODV70773.1 hypothetical protein CYBJADRAFT_56572 [Cyberlindnera jadinii NRRL Y-1542]
MENLWALLSPVWPRRIWDQKNIGSAVFFLHLTGLFFLSYGVSLLLVRIWRIIALRCYRCYQCYQCFHWCYY